MKYALIFLLSLPILSLHAEEMASLETSRQRVLLHPLQGIVLLGRGEKVFRASELRGLEGLAEVGLRVPGGICSLQSKLASFFESAG